MNERDGDCKCVVCDTGESLTKLRTVSLMSLESSIYTVNSLSVEHFQN